MENEEQKWDLIVTPKGNFFKLNLFELWHYRDLIMLLVKRDIVSQYKQTVLGPIWLIVQPVLSGIFFTIIFGNFAKFNTGEIPYPIFTFSGLTIWYFFATTFAKTSSVFITNSSIFGKVYFPRLSVPLSSLISNSVSFFIQFGVFVLLLLYYKFFRNYDFHVNFSLLIFFPPLLLLFGLMGVSIGLLASSLTTKYRDLSFLLSFGLQFLMYFSSVVFPLGGFNNKIQMLLNLNPLMHMVNFFRSIFLSSPSPSAFWLVYSTLFVLVTLFGSIIVFNRVEKSFMDNI